MSFVAAANQLTNRSVIETKLGPDLVSAFDLLLHPGNEGRIATIVEGDAVWRLPNEVTPQLAPLMAPGSEGQTLVIIDGAPTWVTPSFALATASTANPTAPNGSWVLLAEMTLAVVSRGLPFVASFSGSFQSVATLSVGDSCEAALFIDGVEVSSTTREASIGSGLAFSMVTTLAFEHRVSLADGNYTFEVKFRRPGSTGTAKARGILRSLSVREVV